VGVKITGQDGGKIDMGVVSHGRTCESSGFFSQHDISIGNIDRQQIGSVHGQY